MRSFDFQIHDFLLVRIKIGLIKFTKPGVLTPLKKMVLRFNPFAQRDLPARLFGDNNSLLHTFANLSLMGSKPSSDELDTGHRRPIRGTDQKNYSLLLSM